MSPSAPNRRIASRNVLDRSTAGSAKAALASADPDFAQPPRAPLNFEARLDRGEGRPRREPRRRRREHDPRNSVWMLGGEHQRAGNAARVSHHGRAIGARRVHHGKCVPHILLCAIRLGSPRPVGPAVATPVERQDAEVAGEIGDLQLPHARVHDRPRRQQEDRLVPLAVALVEDPHSVALDETLLVGIRRPRLLRPFASSGGLTISPTALIAASPASVNSRTRTSLPRGVRFAGGLTAGPRTRG